VAVFVIICGKPCNYWGKWMWKSMWKMWITPSRALWFVELCKIKKINENINK
jgi:hypothetical protein